MENKIIKMRRVTITEKYQDYEYRMVKNPLFNINEYKEAARNGMGYYHEFIEKEFPVTREAYTYRVFEGVRTL